MVNNNSREVKWLGDSIYRKKLLDEASISNFALGPEKLGMALPTMHAEFVAMHEANGQAL